MATLNQKVKKEKIVRLKRSRKSLLRNNPHKVGYCERILTKSPKKPHSAKRRVANIKIYGYHNVFLRKTYCCVPGTTHNLQKHSKVLIRGGRRRDVPNLHYVAIRGKLDLRGVPGRKTSRSKYGVPLIRGKH